ncbi:glycoside hydrolase family 9 protein [Mucilaginibacter sp. BT774]|uniref:glycoside hydrolase family 9 protein n=1 Tax=Mucilaginibacter sp. BT774 TaxID=3062276 RepID=UPI0026771245|nr:glycoside hydrolase family 9 protein [Mucilaginibacter sp. BT774]MDO3625119.1 glycoside hydrolase family 9 protein [Mucilaginibacter sp. BT774]
MFKKALYISLCLLSFFRLTTSAQFKSDSGKYKIRLNQVGFYPNAPKIVIVLTNKKGSFSLQTPDKKIVFKGILKKSIQPNFAGQYTWIANFSAFTKPGKYVLNVSGLGTSYTFSISKNVHQQVANASIKAFYFMRASTPLLEKYAGKWHRAMGHPDNKVLVHASAVSEGRPEGTLVSSPRGWYDAGDYNKYIVNSGISTYTLLSLYEDFPEYMKTVKLNIPESGNGIPDLLNETLWNLRWMLTMQDSIDGGVYHKLTNAAFDKMEMPDKATEPRYVIQKSTAATLDFTAVMAQSARVFRQYEVQLPGFADSCREAALKAWEWAQTHPHIIYNKYVLNDNFSPKITTGDYGDGEVRDEFIWAASELFVTLKDIKYVHKINVIPDVKMPLPSWSQVRVLGYYTIARNSERVAGTGYKNIAEIKKRIVSYADGLIKDASKTAYIAVMYKKKANFIWGSNSVAANQGIALIQAYKLTGDKKYLKYALDNLDYILGRNGTGYSFVTGYGSKTPMHPHHRPSIADGIVDPIPGLLAGGANPGDEDHVPLPSFIPDEAYTDNDQAYASNEVAINWNSPFAYLANALEALQNNISY